MATQNQINTNRLNAQKSTGPRTAAGKAVSRLNALKTGIDSKLEILYEEDRAKLDALIAEFYYEFQPRGVIERFLVDVIIQDEWMLNRYRFLHGNLCSYTAQVSWESKRGAEHGGGFADNTNAFHRLHRHVVDTKRSHREHLAELKRCQAERRQHEDAVVNPVTDSPETENPEIGFVSQPAPEPFREPVETPLRATNVSEGLPVADQALSNPGQHQPEVAIPATDSSEPKTPKSGSFRNLRMLAGRDPLVRPEAQPTAVSPADPNSAEKP